MKMMIKLYKKYRENILVVVFLFIFCIFFICFFNVIECGGDNIEYFSISTEKKIEIVKSYVTNYYDIFKPYAENLCTTITRHLWTDLLVELFSHSSKFNNYISNEDISNFCSFYLENKLNIKPDNVSYIDYNILKDDLIDYINKYFRLNCLYEEIRKFEYPFFKFFADKVNFDYIMWVKEVFEIEYFEDSNRLTDPKTGEFYKSDMKFTNLSSAEAINNIRCFYDGFYDGLMNYYYDRFFFNNTSWWKTILEFFNLKTKTQKILLTKDTAEFLRYLFEININVKINMFDWKTIHNDIKEYWTLRELLEATENEFYQTRLKYGHFAINELKYLFRMEKEYLLEFIIENKYMSQFSELKDYIIQQRETNQFLANEISEVAQRINQLLLEQNNLDLDMKRDFEDNIVFLYNYYLIEDFESKKQLTEELLKERDLTDNLRALSQSTKI